MGLSVKQLMQLIGEKETKIRHQHLVIEDLRRQVESLDQDLAQAMDLIAEEILPCGC